MENIIYPHIPQDKSKKFSKITEVLEFNSDELKDFEEIHNLYEYFNLDQDDWLDNDKMSKIKMILEWSREQGDMMFVIRDLDLRIGSTDNKVEKFYQYIKLNSEIDKTVGQLNQQIQLQQRL